MINNLKYSHVCVLLLGVMIYIIVNKGYANIDRFIYRPVPKQFITMVSVDVETDQYVDATAYLPLGYSRLGDVDYTKYIQAAINENNNVILPDFPILINDSGLRPKSNSNIYFRKKSKLILKPSNKPQYGVFVLDQVENINIFQPTILGDRDHHIGNKGEWGMGIRIVKSKNIRIVNPNIVNCWGDGIYIGGNGILSSSDIVIEGGLLDNNRRNAISIVNGENIIIKDIVLSNTNGTLPMAGIDLEPNTNHDKLNNISLNNVISFNNKEDGYLIYLGSWLGENQNKTNIIIENCKAYYSNNAMSIPGLRNDYNKRVKKHQGKILIKNFISYDSDEILKKSSGNYQYTPNITIKGVKHYKNGKLTSKKISDLETWFPKRSSKNNFIND